MYKDIVYGGAGDGAGTAGGVWNPFAGQEGVTAMAVGLWRRRREAKRAQGKISIGMPVARVETRGTGPPVAKPNLDGS